MSHLHDRTLSAPVRAGSAVDETVEEDRPGGLLASDGGGGEISTADALNRDSAFFAVDEDRLRAALERDLGEVGAYPRLRESHPSLLAAHPVFVSPEQVRRMLELVAAVETVARSDGYRDAVFSSLPEIARQDHGPLGAFFGYDFHLEGREPRLIEINSNAGGALLNLYLTRSLGTCCVAVEGLAAALPDPERLEDRLIEMFRSEWRRFASGGWRRSSSRGVLRSVAILDENPREQYLHPELRLFERLFERHGIAARIGDPSELRLEHGTLRLGDLPVDVVYNRLTDFYLEDPRNAVLRRAYVDGAVALTPNPRSHALYANKRNLTFLSDPESLRSWGIDTRTIQILTRGVPASVVVTPQNAESLWRDRKKLFFKPLAGYGSRGAYRGDKLTRRVWQSIVASPYIAQENVPPSERRLVVDGSHRALKVDLRCYVYEGRLQLLGARLYRGQTTNFRTEGGGLTTVLTAGATGGLD